MKNRTKNLAGAILLSMATLLAAPAAMAQTTEKPYTYVEQMPSFEGGETAMLQFLGENIRYPEDAHQAGVQGLVVLSFIIEPDGSVTNAQVLKQLSNSTDAEALRVINLMDGKWRPGRQNGKAVPVRYTLPVQFALKGEAQPAAEPQPQYKGGQQALMRDVAQYLDLPEEARKENLNARVVIKFTVQPDGSVGNIELADTKLKKTIGPGQELDYMDASTFNLQNKTILARLAETAAAAVKRTSGNWQPALKNGEPVAAQVYLPVQFLGSETAGAVQLPDEPTILKPEQVKNAYTAAEVDVKPTMENGPLAKHLAKNLRYPSDSNFEGDVEMKLVIDETGKLLGLMLPIAKDRAIAAELNRAFRFAKTNWTPGQKNGKPVTTILPLRIRFVINDGKKANPATESTPADVVVTKFN